MPATRTAALDLDAIRNVFGPDLSTLIRRIQFGTYTYTAIAQRVGFPRSEFRRVRNAIRLYCEQTGVEFPRNLRTGSTRPSVATTAAAVRSGHRRFGIEIEFQRPQNSMSGRYLDPSDIAEALNAAGVPTNVERYNHTTRPTWKLTTDASSDQELVSPPLSGPEGFAQVRSAMRVLRSLGCRITSSEGMHVHLDATDLTGQQIATVFRGYVSRQDAFDAFLPVSRRGGNWCRHINTEMASRIADAFATSRRYAYSSGDRYYAINMAAFGTHGTIEYRSHAGTLNATKALSWVRLLLGFTDAMLAGATVRTDAQGMLDDLVGLGNLPESAADYLGERAGTLN